jgi:fatty acid desaturase
MKSDIIVVPKRAALHQVQWVDLLDLKARDVWHELLISAPWFAGSLIAAQHGVFPIAVCCSFMFFLTGLRQVHNAFHYALGLPRIASDCLMFALSILMLGSMHAVQINHLRHHRHCLAADDIEAMGARLSALGAILLGPRYPWCLHRRALELATPTQRQWILCELAANCIWIGVVFFVFDFAVLRYHIAVMAMGQCLTAFFAVWTTHHGCKAPGDIARTIRNRIKAVITYNMFYHFEHHLFPAVPTCKLPILARRLDALAPNLDVKRVY